MNARFTRMAPLFIPLLALPALWRLLTEGLPQEAADGALHLYRLALLEKHFEAGMLYPRWLPELVLGRGYPLLNFYGPASYYLALAFRLIGLPLASSLAAAMAALVIASGFGAYLLARDTLRSESRWPALVSAVAYIYAPYLLSNVYLRGALAEVAAEALLPWVFWSAGRVMTRRESRAAYLVLLALSMGGVAVIHNITALFLPFAWLPYAAVVWWVNGRRRDDLLWTAAGVAAAVGLSAIFTLPLLVERQYLAATAVEVARGQIGEHVWTWRTFLDARLRFGYSFDPPYKLGLVQLLLATVGLITARRRDPVWLYWIGLAVASGLLMSAWAAPLWQASELLLVAQFPWRLLAWLGLPLALFTGAAVAAVRRPVAQAAAAIGLIALVMFAQAPQLPGLWGWPAVQTSGAVAGLSQFERDTGALGTSSTREFMPKWVESDSPGAVEPAEGGPRVVAIEAASDFELTLHTEGERAEPVRLMTSHFPGWRAEDENGAALATSPTTAMGLLTVNAPAGSHRITLRQEKTGAARAGEAITVATLLALTALALARRSARPIAAATALLLAGVVIAALTRPVASPATEVEPISLGRVTLAGMRADVEADGVWVYPYWWVERTPGADWRVRWRMKDAGGATVAERAARPYHNATSAGDWPPNTLADDAHYLPLPDGARAGEYMVTAQIVDGSGASEEAPVATFSLGADRPPAPQPAQALAAQFGGKIALLGYDPPESRGEPPAGVDAVARAGDALRYTLHWAPPAAVDENLHGFLHVTDAAGGTLATRDQLAGGGSHFPTALWASGSAERDVYPLLVPPDAPSGVYWPQVGLYDFRTLERLPVSAGEFQGQDAARLRPVKVLGRADTRPQKPLDVRVGEFARLTGYSVDAPERGVRPGDAFTVTLFYRANAPAALPYTRFLHFWSPDLGMAAQSDSEPAGGRNPTWSWTRGETVVDAVRLTVAPDVRPGAYQLRAGLYDPANGARVPLRDRDGGELPDDIATIGTIEVMPGR